MKEKKETEKKEVEKFLRKLRRKQRKNGKKMFLEGEEGDEERKGKRKWGKERT